MLVVLWRGRARVAAVPPILLLIMAASSGAPYELVAGLGLKFASAGNGGALTLGILPAFTVILSALILGERIGRRRAMGIGVIVAGALMILGPGLGATSAWPGHLMFVLSAAMWAGFTVAMRLSGLGAMTAAAVVCVFSAMGLPVRLSGLHQAGGAAGRACARTGVPGALPGRLFGYWRLVLLLPRHPVPGRDAGRCLRGNRAGSGDPPRRGRSGRILVPSRGHGRRAPLPGYPRRRASDDRGAGENSTVRPPDYYGRSAARIHACAPSSPYGRIGRRVAQRRMR